MTRTKPYYSLRTIRKCIQTKNVTITQKARATAKSDFNWGIKEIHKALSCLQTKYWYKSEKRYNNPDVWVDYYRCDDLNGEDVYTHFYIENDYLIIDSFKRLYDEML